MKPARLLANTLSTLLAADTANLASATAMKVGLITAPFTPSIDQLMADIEISVLTGLVALAQTAGAQNESIDPITGELIVEIKPPAGGNRWETPVGFTPPVTVYGFALGNNAMTVLLGTHKLDEPIVLTGDNQSITAPPLEFRIDPNKIS
jgi:hypothetical protein